MKNLIKLLILVMVLSSCATSSSRILSEKVIQEKTIPKNSLLIGIVETSASHEPREHGITVYKAKKKVRAGVSIEESSIKITPFDLKNNFSKDTIELNVDLDIDPVPSHLDIASSFYQSSTLKSRKLQLKSLDLKDDGKLNNIYDVDKVSKYYSKAGVLKYNENGTFYQTLTIPFKLRKGKEGKPRDLSTGFNAGFARGYKWNSYKIQPIYDSVTGKMVGYDKRKFTFALAPFVGLISIGLKPSNTNDSVTTEKNVFGLSFGGTAILGLGKFNVGVAGGWDYGLEDSNNWDHQGQPWVGLVLGLDIIK